MRGWTIRVISGIWKILWLCSNLAQNSPNQFFDPTMIFSGNTAAIKGAKHTSKTKLRRLRCVKVQHINYHSNVSTSFFSHIPTNRNPADFFTRSISDTFVARHVQRNRQPLTEALNSIFSARWTQWNTKFRHDIFSAPCSVLHQDTQIHAAQSVHSHLQQVIYI